MFQNGSINLLDLLGGVNGAKERLGIFEKQYQQSTTRSPQEVGMEIKNQIPPEQFQQFAAIADLIVGRK
jgi:hypothetical protein